MKKPIILLLCCGVLVSMVECGSNTDPPTTESPPTTVSETTTIEIPPETTPLVTAVEPTEKEKELVPTESKDQATETTVTVAEPTTTAEPTEETMTAVTSTAEEKATPPIEETVKGTIPQHMESETTETEPPTVTNIPTETEPTNVTEPTHTEKPALFDIDYWITYARSYAENKGLILSDTAVDCWDNPIRAGSHCIYLERDIQSRLDRYAKDEESTDVWIWTEATDNDCYNIYIGYA